VGVSCNSPLDFFSLSGFPMRVRADASSCKLGKLAGVGTAGVLSSMRSRGHGATYSKSDNI
jgi:hypothetical protein